MNKVVDFEEWQDRRAQERCPLIADSIFLEECRRRRLALRLATARQLSLPFESRGRPRYWRRKPRFRRPDCGNASSSPQKIY